MQVETAAEQTERHTFGAKGEAQSLSSCKDSASNRVVAQFLLPIHVA
jgi:hypothetical protein